MARARARLARRDAPLEPGGSGSLHPLAAFGEGPPLPPRCVPPDPEVAAVSMAVERDPGDFDFDGGEEQPRAMSVVWHAARFTRLGIREGKAPMRARCAQARVAAATLRGARCAVLYRDSVTRDRLCVYVCVYVTRVTISDGTNSSFGCSLRGVCRRQDLDIYFPIIPYSTLGVSRETAMRPTATRFLHILVPIKRYGATTDVAYPGTLRLAYRKFAGASTLRSRSGSTPSRRG